eukprot:IDg12733t1
MAGGGTASKYIIFLLLQNPPPCGRRRWYNLNCRKPCSICIGKVKPVETCAKNGNDVDKSLVRDTTETQLAYESVEKAIEAENGALKDQLKGSPCPSSGSKFKCGGQPNNHFLSAPMRSYTLLLSQSRPSA